MRNKKDSDKVSLIQFKLNLQWEKTKENLSGKVEQA
jgi:hypothetical protein